MLNGFDISRYQGGIGVQGVPSDFVIVQHSCGNYVEPTFEAQVGSVLEAGKLLGLYHFVTGAEGEIDTFINGVERYRGRAIIALDWESGQGLNAQWGNWAYLKDFAEAIERRLGVNPLLYASASQYGALQALGNALNCGLWIAQYATLDPTGYQEDPWNEEAYDMAVYQYSDNGSLPGYGGSLDLDLFYGDASAWRAYAHSSLASDLERKLPTMTPLSESVLNANKDTLPVNAKVTIANKANKAMYLISHDGGLQMSSEAMPWFIQRNADQSISLADPWGNWITVPSDVKNGDLPSVVKGNGSSEQRWMASPFHGGFELTTLVDNQMRLDLPDDVDKEGQRVQVWGKWPNEDACPNQTWEFQPYHESAPSAIKPSTPAKEGIAKPLPKVAHDAHFEVPAKTKVETAPVEKEGAKADKPKEAHVAQPDDSQKDDKEARIIADLKDLSDISKSEDAQVGDEIAGVVQAMFHTKKATKKMANWIFVLGAVFALASTVLLILSGCGALPASGGAIAGIVSAVFSAFAHAMGITLVKTK